MTVTWTRAAALRAGCACIVLGAAGAARGSGYALKEQSTTYQGSAFAGATAGGLDATTIFFNPAGMTGLPGGQVVGSGSYLAIDSDFSGAASFAPALGGGAVSGLGEQSGIGRDAVVPSFYASWEAIPDALWLGFGLNAPWGLTNEYDMGWVGRYQALESTLRTYNFQPSLAWKVTPRLSLGGGLQIQYAEAVLSQAIDFGAITGLGPGSLDGVGKVAGGDWAVGFTLGAVYAFDDKTRIGASFRSAVGHTLTGEATTSGVPSVAALTALFAATGATAEVTTPEIVSIGVHRQLDERWAVMADVSWTNWSRFDVLRVDYDNPLRPDSVTEEHWSDAFFVALGLSYKRNDWTLRAGVAFDQSPVPDEFRTPRLPDSDRYWLSVGFSYDVSKTVTISSAYTHIFVEDAAIALSDDLSGNEAFRTSLSGRNSSAADIISAQIKVAF